MRILILFFAFLTVASPAVPTASSIVDAYVSAHRQRNVEALMALVEFNPETPTSVVELQRSLFQQSLDLRIIDVRVLPLDQDDRKSLAALRNIYDPTLEPVEKFVVTWDMSTQKGPAKTPSLTKFLGIKDGQFRFVTSKTKEARATEPNR